MFDAAHLQMFNRDLHPTLRKTIFGIALAQET
jgi:hypothetical protein